MAFQYENFVITELASQASEASLSLAVRDLTKIPAVTPGNVIRLTLYDGDQAPELVDMTSKDTSSITVVRGREGTSARIWRKGSKIFGSLTSEMLEGWMKLHQIWTLQSMNYLAVSGDLIMADTSAGSWTLTLPATPQSGDAVQIQDAGDSFHINNLTIARNGSTIMGLAENMLVDVQRASFTLIYNTTTWRIS